MPLKNLKPVRELLPDSVLMTFRDNLAMLTALDLHTLKSRRTRAKHINIMMYKIINDLHS